MFSLKVCNIDGLQKDGRWEFVCDNLVDFMALTETHATDFVHTKFDKKVADSPYGILWGEPLGDRLYAGVAFVYRKSSAWSVQKIEFQHHPCNKFYREGRLMAVQVHRSSQKRSCIFYILYGIAGARWDAGKRENGPKYDLCSPTGMPQPVVLWPQSFAVTSIWRLLTFRHKLNNFPWIDG